MLTTPLTLDSTQDMVAKERLAIAERSCSGLVPMVGWGHMPPASQLHGANICLALYISLRRPITTLALTRGLSIFPSRLLENHQAGGT